MGYNLRNLKVSYNAHDGSPYCSGSLFFNDEEVVRFYEHPIEGGYYANGKELSEDLFETFIKSNQTGLNESSFNFEIEAFDKGISLLMKDVDLSLLDSEELMD